MLVAEDVIQLQGNTQTSLGKFSVDLMMRRSCVSKYREDKEWSVYGPARKDGVKDRREIHGSEGTVGRVDGHCSDLEPIDCLAI